MQQQEGSNRERSEEQQEGEQQQERSKRERSSNRERRKKERRMKGASERGAREQQQEREKQERPTRQRRVPRESERTTEKGVYQEREFVVCPYHGVSGGGQSCRRLPPLAIVELQPVESLVWVELCGSAALIVILFVFLRILVM